MVQYNTHFSCTPLPPRNVKGGGGKQTFSRQALDNCPMPPPPPQRNVQLRAWKVHIRFKDSIPLLQKTLVRHGMVFLCGHFRYLHISDIYTIIRSLIPGTVFYKQFSPCIWSKVFQSLLLAYNVKQLNLYYGLRIRRLDI